MIQQTLQMLGGLDAFRDFVAADVAMGIEAHELGIPVSLGPIIDSPVGEMSLGSLLNKFSSAALFGITMKTGGETLHYVVLYSRGVTWVGIKYRVHSNGRMTRLTTE